LRHEQVYRPGTNSLITRYWHPDGIGEVEDDMPVGGTGGGPADRLIRRVRVVRRRMPFRLECRPAFDYARARHEMPVGPADPFEPSRSAMTAAPSRRGATGTLSARE
jgi:hypothetical protein